MAQLICQTGAGLPEPWRRLTYPEILGRAGGLMVNGGRASQVHLFTDDDSRCYLKRYLYNKIHWRDCGRASQARREYENLEKIRGRALGCRPIEILAYGEERRWRTLRSAFVLSREVAGGERLSLFLGQAGPNRAQVVAALINCGARIMQSGLALGDLFFRNLVVVPEAAELYLLDLQFCGANRHRAREKSYPQFWSNVRLFFRPDEATMAAARLAPLLPYSLAELDRRAAAFLPREEKRRHNELALAARIATGEPDHE